MTALFVSSTICFCTGHFIAGGILAATWTFGAISWLVNQ